MAAFKVSIYPERLKGRLTGVLERSPGGLARAAVAQPDTNLESEIQKAMAVTTMRLRPGHFQPLEYAVESPSEWL